MTELFDQLPVTIQPPKSSASGRVSKNGKPLGRPPGAKNRRSVDLARYIEATFAGLTPGQQSAEIALVKPADLARAKRQAQELGIVDLDLPKLLLAMVVKAHQLAKALGCDRETAWLMLAKERIDLIPYIHQKQPIARDSAERTLPTMFVVSPEDIEQAIAAPQDDDAEFVEDFDLPAEQVGQDKSDDAT